jgi:hypothetical protein
MGLSCVRQSSKSLCPDKREPAGICDGPENSSASTLVVITSILVSQKQRGMNSVKDREESAVVTQNTCLTFCISASIYIT